MLYIYHCIQPRQLTFSANLGALAKQGILLENYFSTTHPSEPNYVASAGGDNFGMDNDDLNEIPANVSSVADLLKFRDISWAEYNDGHDTNVTFAGSFIKDFLPPLLANQKFNPWDTGHSQYVFPLFVNVVIYLTNLTTTFSLAFLQFDSTGLKQSNFVTFHLSFSSGFFYVNNALFHLAGS
jgi:hypothetical protein